MDTVTQFALGAGIGAAVLGRRIGVRKAALTGGLLATLPDTDVFWPFENDVARFVEHRSATHSLIMHTLATPLFGEILRKIFREAERRPFYLAVFLCLTTHALLDALTIYGTQLFWPIWKEPLALGSMFIIDPVYTLPLLVITLWAVFQKNWTARFGKALTAALLITTGYLGWSAWAQTIAEARADKVLAARGITPSQRIATPTAFNTLFWRVVAMDGPRYFSLYVPLVGGPDKITAYVHNGAGGACIDHNPQAKTLAAFSRGFYQIRRNGDDTILADLRMGLPPNEVFQYVIANSANGPLQNARRLPSVRSADGDMDWLWAGITGESAPRPAEFAARFDLNKPTRLAGTQPPASKC